ncbi:hypothetical protein EJB05_50322, partial [Eragrostis curvula]
MAVPTPARGGTRTRMRPRPRRRCGEPQGEADPELVVVLVEQQQLRQKPFYARSRACFPCRRSWCALRAILAARKPKKRPTMAKMMTRITRTATQHSESITQLEGPAKHGQSSLEDEHVQQCNMDPIIPTSTKNTSTPDQFDSDNMQNHRGQQWTEKSVRSK